MDIGRAILVIIAYWDELFGKEIEHEVTEVEQCPYILLADDGYAVGYVGRKSIEDGSEFILDPSMSDIEDMDEDNLFRNKMAEYMGTDSATIEEIKTWVGIDD